MVELDFFARFYKMSDEDVIDKLHAAGMDSCPGGGAEIFAEPTRSRICDHKCDADRWLELAGKVHKAGLKTNATMLYGHIESIEDRVDHFVQLREQQDRTGGFQCFIPLAFYPPGTALSSLPGPDAIDNLKTIARQLRPRQGLLGHARQSHRPNRPPFRRQRPRRHYHRRRRTHAQLFCRVEQ
jgi:aminodeoxyfutalosine synthase